MDGPQVYRASEVDLSKTNFWYTLTVTLSGEENLMLKENQANRQPNRTHEWHTQCYGTLQTESRHSPQPGQDSNF